MPLSSTALAVCIDATRPAALWRLWGMSLMERQLREVARLGADAALVLVSPATEDAVQHLRPDYAKLTNLEPTFVPSTDPSAVLQPLVELGRPVLFLQGDVVYDDRVLSHLVGSGPNHAVRGAETEAVYVGKEDVGAHCEARLTGIASTGTPAPPGQLEPATVQTTRLDELDAYVPALRLTMPPFMVRLSDPAQLPQVDRLMYRRTFKGVIDAVALYGYYHLVRRVTRQLSRTTLPPDLFTVLSILGIWGAIPCFAAGHLAGGVILAWVGVILDSVDGKLARLTLHLSDTMGNIEHIAAMPGLGLWFVALGWHLTGGALLTPSPAAWTCAGMLVCFLADKVVTGGFRSLTGGELFDYRPIDAAFHLVAARRNIHLLILTLGVLVDDVGTAFAAVTGWMAATLFFHLIRFGWGVLASDDT